MDKDTANQILDALQTKLSADKDAYRLAHGIFAYLGEFGRRSKNTQLEQLSDRLQDRANIWWNIAIGARAAKEDISEVDPEVTIADLRKETREDLGSVTPGFILTGIKGAPGTDKDVRDLLEQASDDPWIKRVANEAYDRFVQKREALKDFEKDPYAFAGLPSPGQSRQ